MQVLPRLEAAVVGVDGLFDPLAVATHGRRPASVPASAWACCCAGRPGPGCVARQGAEAPRGTPGSGWAGRRGSCGRCSAAGALGRCHWLVGQAGRVMACSASGQAAAWAPPAARADRAVEHTARGVGRWGWPRAVACGRGRPAPGVARSSARPGGPAAAAACVRPHTQAQRPGQQHRCRPSTSDCALAECAWAGFAVGRRAGHASIAAGAAACGTLPGRAGGRRPSSRPTLYRHANHHTGPSGPQVTPICLGTMTFGEQVTPPCAHEILDRAAGPGHQLHRHRRDVRRAAAARDLWRHRDHHRPLVGQPPRCAPAGGAGHQGGRPVAQHGLDPPRRGRPDVRPTSCRPATTACAGCRPMSSTCTRSTGPTATPRGSARCTSTRPRTGRRPPSRSVAGAGHPGEGRQGAPHRPEQ
jgi:hypothetical protein